MEPSIELYRTFDFELKHRDAFRQGSLQRKWAREYPFLFDKIDQELAQNQRFNHFFEWLAAICVYEETGYLSLVEKYQYPRHKDKRETFRDIVPVPLYELLMPRGKFGHRQGPDLFVFDPNNRTNWFFCEVKGLRDYLRQSQLELFREIAKVSDGKPIRLIQFQVKPR
jgi:hypothetical protein